MWSWWNSLWHSIDTLSTLNNGIQLAIIGLSLCIAILMYIGHKASQQINHLQVLKSEAERLPRQLSAQQQETIIQKLIAFKGAKIHIYAVYGNPDTYDYSQYFVSALKHAGWNVDFNPQLVFGQASVGLTVSVKNPSKLPLGTAELISVLKELNLQVNAQYNPQLNEEDSVVLTVGNRQ